MRPANGEPLSTVVCSGGAPGFSRARTWLMLKFVYPAGRSFWMFVMSVVVGVIRTSKMSLKFRDTCSRLACAAKYESVSA